MKCAQLLKGVNIVESFCNCNDDFNQSGVQSVDNYAKEQKKHRSHLVYSTYRLYVLYADNY